MEIKWNEEKNTWLKRERGVSFEDVVDAIIRQDYIGPEENPSRENQWIIIVRINDYPCVVPFVKDENGDWFLKTIFQSRKMKKRFDDEK